MQKVMTRVKMFELSRHWPQNQCGSRQSRQSTGAKIENDINTRITRPGHETFLSSSTTVIKLNNCKLNNNLT